MVPVLAGSNSITIAQLEFGVRLSPLVQVVLEVKITNGLETVSPLITRGARLNPGLVIVTVRG